MWLPLRVWENEQRRSGDMNGDYGEKDILGRGLAFPFQVNQRGEIALVTGQRDVEQSIRIILETAPGERVMRPEFGCRAHELLFAPRANKH